MFGAGVRLVDKVKTVAAFGPAVPSSAAPPYVALRKYRHLGVLIQGLNGASGITAATIAFNQAQDVSGTAAKTLPYTVAWVNADVGANGDALTNTAVSGNSLTAPSAASKQWEILIDLDAQDLDQSNGFADAALVLGNAAAQTISVTYFLMGPTYGENVALLPTSLTD